MNKIYHVFFAEYKLAIRTGADFVGNKQHTGGHAPKLPLGKKEIKSENPL